MYRVVRSGTIFLAMALLAIAIAAVPDYAEAANKQTTSTKSSSEKLVGIHRLYDSGSGEHHYTSDNNEKRVLCDIHGWNYEGIAWYAPTKGEPVYRLYNRRSGEHLYTRSLNERNTLIKRGWKSEGIGWYSDSKKRYKVERLYNRNLPPIASHHYTGDSNEVRVLRTHHGWKYEGVAWYGAKAGHKVKDGWVRVGNNWQWWYNGAQIRSRWINTVKRPTGGNGALVKYYIGANGYLAKTSKGSPTVQLKDYQRRALNKAISRGSRTNWYIVTNISNNRMTIFHRVPGRLGWYLYQDWPVTTGAIVNGTSKTLLGDSAIRYRMPAMHSTERGGWSAYWVIQWGKGYYHSITYRYRTWRVQSARMGASVSNGCIRLQTPNAKWVYDTVPNRTSTTTWN